MADAGGDDQVSAVDIGVRLDLPGRDGIGWTIAGTDPKSGDILLTRPVGDTVTTITVPRETYEELRKKGANAKYKKPMMRFNIGNSYTVPSGGFRVAAYDDVTKRALVERMENGVPVRSWTSSLDVDKLVKGLQVPEASEGSAGVSGGQPRRKEQRRGEVAPRPSKEDGGASVGAIHELPLQQATVSPAAPVEQESQPVTPDIKPEETEQIKEVVEEAIEEKEKTETVRGTREEMRKRRKTITHDLSKDKEADLFVRLVASGVPFQDQHFQEVLDRVKGVAGKKIATSPAAPRDDSSQAPSSSELTPELLAQAASEYLSEGGAKNEKTWRPFVQQSVQTVALSPAADPVVRALVESPVAIKGLSPLAATREGRMKELAIRYPEKIASYATTVPEYADVVRSTKLEVRSSKTEPPTSNLQLPTSNFLPPAGADLSVTAQPSVATVGVEGTMTGRGGGGGGAAVALAGLAGAAGAVGAFTDAQSASLAAQGQSALTALDQRISTAREQLRQSRAQIANVSIEITKLEGQAAQASGAAKVQLQAQADAAVEKRRSLQDRDMDVRVQLTQDASDREGVQHSVDLLAQAEQPLEKKRLDAMQQQFQGVTARVGQPRVATNAPHLASRISQRQKGPSGDTSSKLQAPSSPRPNIPALNRARARGIVKPAMLAGTMGAFLSGQQVDRRADEAQLEDAYEQGVGGGGETTRSVIESPQRSYVIPEDGTEIETLDLMPSTIEAQQGIRAKERQMKETLALHTGEAEEEEAQGGEGASPAELQVQGIVPREEEEEEEEEEPNDELTPTESQRARSLLTKQEQARAEKEKKEEEFAAQTSNVQGFKNLYSTYNKFKYATAASGVGIIWTIISMNVALAAKLTGPKQLQQSKIEDVATVVLDIGVLASAILPLLLPLAILGALGYGGYHVGDALIAAARGWIGL